jgi:hypothetical protein
MLKLTKEIIYASEEGKEGRLEEIDESEGDG